MKEFTIEKNDAGQRLDKFIFKLAPSIPKTLLFKSIRKKDIKVNKKRAEASYLLQEGDLVETYLHSKFFGETNLDFLSASPIVTVIYEDANVILMDKPAGLLSHSGSDGEKDNLVDRMLHYLYQKGDYSPEKELSFTPALCNRVDRNTRGLLLGVKNLASLQLINEKIRNHEVTRKYLALVNGALKDAEGLLSGYLVKDQISNKVTITDKPVANSKKVETRYRVIEKRGATTLVEAELLTGRSHQIRAQFAKMGYPLVGDKKYGDTSGVRGQKLVSYHIGFDFTSDNAHLDYLKGQHFQLEPTEELL